jgi:hypothetical protein
MIAETIVSFTIGVTLSTLVTTHACQGIRFPAEARDFSLLNTSTPALGPTKFSIQRVPVAILHGVQCLKREVDHSPPNAEVELCVNTYVRLLGVVIDYAQGQPYLCFTQGTG